MDHATTVATVRTPPTTPGVWQVVREFPRPVWCLLGGMFINRFGTFVLPFLALYVAAQGYSPVVAGWVVGAFGAGHLVASALGGHLADTVGPRRTIVASMSCGAVTMLWLSQAHSLPALMLLAFLNGLCGEFYRPASSALLASLVPEERRVTAYAAYRFAINAGFAFGPAVAGMLAGRSYFWLFVGNAAAALTYGVIALVWLPRDVLTSPPTVRQVLDAGPSLLAAAHTAWNDPRFRQLTLASFAVAAVFMQLFTTLGLAMQAAGLPPSTYGVILCLNGALIVLFELPATGYTRRYPPRRVIACGFALIGLGASLMTGAASVGGFALGMAVMTAGEILSMPVAMAYAASLSPVSMRGRTLGLYGLTWAAAMAVGPACGSAAFALHPAALWMGCGALGLAAGAIMLRGPARRDE